VSGERFLKPHTRESAEEAKDFDSVDLTGEIIAWSHPWRATQCKENRIFILTRELDNAHDSHQSERVQQ